MCACGAREKGDDACTSVRGVVGVWRGAWEGRAILLSPRFPLENTHAHMEAPPCARAPMNLESGHHNSVDTQAEKAEETRTRRRSPNRCRGPLLLLPCDDAHGAEREGEKTEEKGSGDTAKEGEGKGRALWKAAVRSRAEDAVSFT